MNTLKKSGKKIAMTIGVPIAVYLFFFVLCYIVGNTSFGSSTDMNVILRNTVYTGFIALAVSYHLTGGRLDFSVGATLILATTIGGLAVETFHLGPLSFLLLSMAAGVVIGLVSGIIYTTTKLPPMVLTLGLAMVYEAIAFVLTKGAGVKFLGQDNILIWSKSPYVYLLIIVTLVVLYFVLNKTQFGFNFRSIAQGQEISVNVGINEVKNAIICFVMGGIFMAIAGVINTSVLGTITPKLGLGSASYIQNAFLPFFIGNILEKHCDKNLGVVIGALTQSIIFTGIGRLGIPTAWQSVITSAITLVFFAYSFNSYKIVERRKFKEKKKKAMEALGTQTSH